MGQTGAEQGCCSWAQTSAFSFLYFYLAAPGLSHGMWDLVPRPAIKPGRPSTGQNLSHQTTKETPLLLSQEKPEVTFLCKISFLNAGS